MKLANLLMDRRIRIDLKAHTKAEAVDELLDLLRAERVALDYDDIVRSVRIREEIESTSYGRGFAFPHARTNAVSELYILIGVSREGLDEGGPDGVPVHVVCLLLTPSAIAKLYLQTLSGLATFARMPGSLDRVRSIINPRDLVKLVADTGVTVDKELMVKDIMRHDVAKVRPDDTLKDVANEMFRHRLSALAVVDENNRLLGVISDRDLIKAALPDYRTLISNLNYSLDVEPFEELLKREDKIKVSQLYREDFETTTPETRIVEVAAMMIFKDFTRVFVTENDNLVGILLRKDIVNMIIRG
ncbi:MAG TPA: CBS domain-containing protein [candidate division Zixibacteria bacterium]|nr:CBS domain-containing protein [candidate division Zixibacteria bacterium]MDD4916581.1 CBS domain-containing protein [candidate division Zixibacteria bacterium]MDM7973747.1 CBS domain-containing protein [candidate division Zixibacteria bacterium]HOD65768.1 CBS domain-containing protein [candidate division Zixibacteria bacterium]HPC11243.1 CBS domain-containing protein [candidate division Zixibacteria bacterium]